MRKINLYDNSNEFRDWLKENALSRRAINDCISRCRRIEKEFGIDLNHAVSSKEKYLDLMAKIKQFAESGSPSKTYQYALSASLRSAGKKYAQFKGKDYFRKKNT